MVFMNETKFLQVDGVVSKTCAQCIQYGVVRTIGTSTGWNPQPHQRVWIDGHSYLAMVSTYAVIKGCTVDHRRLADRAGLTLKFALQGLVPFVILAFRHFAESFRAHVFGRNTGAKQ